MELNDHDDFPMYGEHLKGKRVGFIVTGGIAAYTAPTVIRALRRYSCEVYPYVTEHGLRFVTEDALAWAANRNVVSTLTYKSEHLGQDNSTFDAIVVYGATYSIIAKIANGIADDAATTLVASHISHAKIICIPTMHGNMWDSPILQENIAKLSKLSNVVVVKPRLENNKANVPDTATCVCNIVREMSESRLKGVKLLVTAGPTPVKIDNVRRIVNRFSGKLGIEIANELFLRGADVFLMQSYSGIRPPNYINHMLFEDYEEYRDKTVEYCKDYEYGIFSAAVADYKPKEVVVGKIPSGGAITSLDLIETQKVIKLVRQANPAMKMISFKYEEGKNLSDLVEIAKKRLLDDGHIAVVANDITLNTDKQKCFYTVLSKYSSVPYVVATAEGKLNIARMIANQLENGE